MLFNVTYQNYTKSGDDDDDDLVNTENIQQDDAQLFKGRQSLHEYANRWIQIEINRMHIY